MDWSTDGWRRMIAGSTASIPFITQKILSYFSATHYVKIRSQRLLARNRSAKKKFLLISLTSFYFNARNVRINHEMLPRTKTSSASEVANEAIKTGTEINLTSHYSLRTIPRDFFGRGPLDAADALKRHMEQSWCSYKRFKVPAASSGSHSLISFLGNSPQWIRIHLSRLSVGPVVSRRACVIPSFLISTNRLDVPLRVCLRQLCPTLHLRLANILQPEIMLERRFTCCCCRTFA